jgi:hypothetical protein
VSTEAIGHAFGQRLPGTEKWVLVCLARYADEWGYSVFPAIEELADKTGFSAATCKRTLKELIRLERIQRIARATPVSPAFYRIIGVPPPENPKPGDRHLPAALRRAVIYEFEHRCEYCGVEGTKENGPDGKAWQIDRVVPGARGGVYCPQNVTLSCKSCNNKKKTKPAPEGTRTLTALQNARDSVVTRAQSAPSPLAVSQDSPGDQDEPREGAASALGGVAADPDLSNSSSDHFSHSGSAGAAPRRLADPDENLPVITKLAHEVLELLSETPDVDERDVVDGIERRCDVFDIAFTRDLVHRAIAAAVYQRRRAGKPAVLKNSTGDSAFRMKEAG